MRSAVFRQRQLLRFRQFHAGKPLLENAGKDASDKVGYIIVFSLSYGLCVDLCNVIFQALDSAQKVIGF